MGRCFGVAPGVMWRTWTWPEVWGVYGCLVEIEEEGLRKTRTRLREDASARQARTEESGRYARATGTLAERGVVTRVCGVGEVGRVGAGAEGVGAARVVVAGRNWKEGFG